MKRRNSGTLDDKFWRYTARGPDPQGCWIWTGTRYNTGYGKITHRYQQLLAHRVSYELHHGTISQGLQIDHLCFHRWCVNPDHLEVVTSQVNTQRGHDRGCRNGHPWKDPYITREGHRRCRLCARATDRRRRQREREVRYSS